MSGNPQLLYLILSLGSGLIALALGIQGWRRRHITGSKAFIAMMAAVAAWTFFYALEVSADTVESILFAQRLKYFGVTTLPVAWLLFTGRYSGRFAEIKPAQLGGLLVIPAISLLLVWTSDFHDLFFVGQPELVSVGGFITIIPTYGIWWMVNLIYTYFLILVGAYWLVTISVDSIDVHQTQSQMILLGIAIPVLGNIISLTNIGILRGLDLAPMLFTISAVIFERFLLQARSMISSAISYHAIIDNLPEAVMVVDADLKILSVNPPLLRLLRFSEEEILGDPVEMYMPEVVPHFGQQLGWISTTHEVVMGGRYLELSISALDNEDNKIDAFVLTFRDNTIRKQTENALYSNERRYRTLFEKSNDAIFILELDGSLIVANTEGADLLNTDLGKLLQHGIEHYIPQTELEAFHQRIGKLVAGENIPIFETFFVRFNGDEVPTEVSLTLVLTPDGEPSQVQMIVRDITERKQAEQMRDKQLEQFKVLREVDDLVNSTLDIQNVIDVSLDAAMRLSGADAGFIAVLRDETVTIEQVRGMYKDQYIGEELRYDVGVSGFVLEMHEPILVRDVAINPNYVPTIPETKSLMSIPLISQERLVGLLNLESTEFAYFTQNMFDLLKLLAGRVSVAIENARLYDYVRQQLSATENINEELRQAETLKTDMIRIANHDIKNPLSIAQGYVSVMQMDIEVLPDDYEEYLGAMWKALSRIQGILDDFMSVEAINQRATGATMRTLDVRDMVMMAVEEYEPQILSKLQTLTMDISEKGQALVLGDKAQLYEAVTNILGNASKYTQDTGAIQINLKVENEMVVYEVIDNGFGIPDDRQGRMFEPFYRAKVAEASNIDGTGLGLHLVKNIVERHGGEMIFHSVYQEGSTFGFRIPLTTQPVEDSEPPALTEEPTVVG